MTTNFVPADDYATDEIIYRNDISRSGVQDSYLEMFPNDSDAFPQTSKNGTYNIVSKDYGDHQVNYYIPKEYGNEYGISQLEDMSLVEEQPLRNPSGVVQQRVYQQYDGFDYDNGYGYVEEVSAVTPRTIVNVSPGHHRETQVITEIYEPPPPPPTETIEYIYETQPPPVIEEEVEYIVEERAPQPIYVEEPRPVRRTVIIQPPPPPPPPPVRSARRTIIIPRSPSPEPIRTTRRTLVLARSPSPEPIRSTRRTLVLARSPSPEPIRTPRRTLVLPRSPSPDPTKSSRRTLLFPKSPPIPTHRTTRRITEVSETISTRKQRTVRSPSLPVRPIKSNMLIGDDQPPSLMEVVAQNRVNRGGRRPKPKREVHEDKPYDLPTYRRNIIKNGFLVHK